MTGAATLAAYQTALSAVRFNNTSNTPDTTARTLDVTVNDGLVDSNIAHATVTVTAVNDAPVTGNDTVVTNIGNGTAFLVSRLGLAGQRLQIPKAQACPLPARARANSLTRHAFNP